jgi:predicted GNAT family acetyltransferase
MTSEHDGDPAVIVQKNESNSTWEALLDGQLVGVVVYEQVGPARVALTHAAIEEHHRKHGIGTNLISTMLNDLRAHHQTITVWCTAVVDFLEKHPEYRDLVDPAAPGRASIAGGNRQEA